MCDGDEHSRPKQDELAWQLRTGTEAPAPGELERRLVDAGRRRFLSQTLSGLTGATIALAGGKKSMYAFAEDQLARPNLICIHLGGGWDTNWWYNAYPIETARQYSTSP